MHERAADRRLHAVRRRPRSTRLGQLRLKRAEQLCRSSWPLLVNQNAQDTTGAAVRGPNKVESPAAALGDGVVAVVVTDVTTAQEILERA